MGSAQSKQAEPQDKHSANREASAPPQRAISPPWTDRRWPDAYGVAMLNRWSMGGTTPSALVEADHITQPRPRTNRNSRLPSTNPRYSDTPYHFYVDPVEGHSDVSRPPQPPRIHSLSELIDPAEISIDSHVRSPSGNLLAPEQFLVHPARPRSMRERQQEIREKVRAASRLGTEVENVPDKKSKKGGARKSGSKLFCIGCFGG
jgi:hypothetical protein